MNSECIKSIEYDGLTSSLARLKMISGIGDNAQSAEIDVACRFFIVKIPAIERRDGEKSLKFSVSTKM